MMPSLFNVVNYVTVVDPSPLLWPDHVTDAVSDNTEITDILCTKYACRMEVLKEWPRGQ